MSELTIGQLIKIIIGVLVVVIVVFGVYLFFREQVINFFKSMFTIGDLILGLII